MRRQKIPTQNNLGFTITEVISVLGITMIIMLVIYQIFLVAQKTFTVANEKLELTQNARIFLDRLSRELRQTPAIATALPATKTVEGFPAAAELMFQDGHDVPDIQYLRYFLDNGLIKRQRLVYYFASDPGTYVYYNATDEFGQPALNQVEEEKIIAEYATQILFYGDKTTYLEIFLNKGSSFEHFYTGVWGRNTRY